METSSYFGACLVGGVMDFPSFAYPNRPISITTTKEQIGIATSIATIIPVIGNVTTSVFGNQVNGININTPGTLGETLGNQQNPQEAQVGFTGSVGG